MLCVFEDARALDRVTQAIREAGGEAIAIAIGALSALGPSSSHGAPSSGCRLPVRRRPTNEAAAISRKTGSRYSGPMIQGAIALLTDDAAVRARAVPLA